MSNHYVHSIFTLPLIKQIFEKNKSLRAASKSRTQVWLTSTPDWFLYDRDLCHERFNLRHMSIFLSKTKKQWCISKQSPFQLKLFLASLQQSDWFSRSWQSMNEKITQWVKVLPSESAGLEFKLQGVLSLILQCFRWSFSGQKHASREKCYPLVANSECALGHTCKQ